MYYAAQHYSSTIRYFSIRKKEPFIRSHVACHSCRLRKTPTTHTYHLRLSNNDVRHTRTKDTTKTRSIYLPGIFQCSLPHFTARRPRLYIHGVLERTMCPTAHCSPLRHTPHMHRTCTAYHRQIKKKSYTQSKVGRLSYCLQSERAELISHSCHPHCHSYDLSTHMEISRNVTGKTCIKKI